jgi:hypothetical protein
MFFSKPTTNQSGKISFGKIRSRDGPLKFNLRVHLCNPIIPYRNKKGEVICPYYLSQDDPKRCVIYIPLEDGEQTKPVWQSDDDACKFASKMDKMFITSIKQPNTKYEFSDKLKVKLNVDFKTGELMTRINEEVNGKITPIPVRSMTELEKLMKSKKYIEQLTSGPDVTCNIKLDSYWIRGEEMGIVYKCMELTFHVPTQDDVVE